MVVMFGRMVAAMMEWMTWYSGAKCSRMTRQSEQAKIYHTYIRNN